MLQVNGTTSTTYHMPGGGHQGTLLRALKYFVQWNDNANWVRSQSGLRFINVDDLTILEPLSLSFRRVLANRLSSTIGGNRAINQLYTTSQVSNITRKTKFSQISWHVFQD